MKIKRFFKKGLTILLAAVMLMTLCTPFAFAAGEGIYTYEVADGKATVTGCDSKASGAIDIPAILGGFPVTSIGEYAFWYCGSLTSVTIPDSVRMIDERAFRNCGLTSIVIPESVTSIGEEAFRDSSLTSITLPDSVTSIEKWTFRGCGSLTSAIIPGSVKSIGDEAFQDCGSLINVTIGDGVKSIGKNAFADCGLTSLVIPDSVTSIGDYAFSGCGSLTGVAIPESVTSIGDGVFGSCASLTSVTIPDSVESIGKMAFANCTSLKSVTIPESVTSIASSAFSGCASLTALDVEAANLAYSSADGVLFSKDESELIRYPGGKAGAYAIPDGVTSIGDDAFSDCGSLTGVTIPESVTSIGAGAFQDCSSLKSVNIPDSVTSIGKRAFYGCGSLTSLTIPDSVTSIGNSAFYGCGSLASLTISGGVTSIESGTFQDCSSLTSLTIPDGVTSIGDYVFTGCGSLSSVTIPESVTSIGDNAFYYCYNFVIYGMPGSYAETYANYKAIPFVAFVVKTQLDALIAEAGQLKSGGYTTESWAEFAGALQAARTVSAKEEATQTEVDNAYAELFAAREQLVTLDAAAAKKVDDQIEALSDPVTLLDKAAIDTARAAYNALTEEQQDLVTKLTKLKAAEAYYDQLKAGQVKRIAGDDRYGTSAKTALDAYPEGAETVIIARGDDQGDFSDALAAGYLAGVEKAPILLTSPGSLPQEIEVAVKQLGAHKAYVLGGELAVSQGVADRLISLGLEVERITGNNRYATAAAIAARGGPADTAIVVCGFAPADSLAAGPLAFSKRYPILLVDKNSVPTATKKAIAELGVKNIIIIGGENAVGRAVYDELNAEERYAGQNRIETSLAVAENYFATAKGFTIVGYLKLADAVGAAVCGHPIVYVKDDLSDVEDYLTEATELDTRFTLIGGTLAVGDTVENELKKLVQ